MSATAKVLFLRTCGADMSSRSGFVWPGVGGVAVAPDWDPQPICGFGLHGLLWGEGDVSQLSSSGDARWLVCEAEEADVVHIDRKIKVPRATVLFVGGREEAVAYMVERATGRAVCFARITAGARGTATAGYAGTATAGDDGTATAGARGEIRIRWWDGYANRYRTVVGAIGENGLEPNKRYRLDAAHAFVEVLL